MVIYTVDRTTAFKKDVQRARKRGLDLEKLQLVIKVLASGERLPASCRDHALKGGQAGRRECHIGPDWLMIYERIETRLTLLLIRTGTHRELGVGG